MTTTFRAAGLVVALCCAAAWLPAQNAPINIQEELLRADKQFDLYAYNLARTTYEKVLQSDPNNAHALARVGDCYVQLNRPETALPWYERAESASSPAPEIWLRHGKALMSTGNYTAAKQQFVQYAQSNAALGRHFADMCDYALSASNKTALYTTRNEAINTESADYAPAFFLNSSRVVYSSARTDLKRDITSRSSSDWSGSSATNQLFVSERTGDADAALQIPKFLRSDLQNTWNESPISFSADGRRIVFCRNNFIDGTRQIAETGVNLSLYFADVDNGEWKNVRAFPYNGSDYSTGFPCLSPDGNTLWFASNRPEGMGGWDIYVCTRNGTEWSTPRNLGLPLNTPGNEITPFFDGATLYFSSDYHRGFGGMDVFRAELSGDDVTNVYHLGPGINSPRDDYGFIYDPSANVGYLVSNRTDGRGNEDLWQVRKKLDEFVISVTDEYRNPLADAEIDFSACGAGIMRTDASGQYSFAVGSGNANCTATVRKTGYQAATVNIRSSGNKKLAVSLASTPAATYQPPAEPTPAAATTTPAAYDLTTGNGALVDHALYLFDAYSRPLANAQVDLGTCGLGTLLTDQAGSVSFSLPAGTLCCMVINKSGYDEAVIPITSSSAGSKSVSLGENKNPAAPIPTGTVGTYAGRILDAEYLHEVANALIKVQKLPNGPIMQTTSSNAGRFIFNLEAGAYYQFSFLKIGYEQETMNFVISINNTAHTIAPVFLRPAGTTATTTTAPAQYSTTTAASPLATVQTSGSGTRMLAQQQTAPATSTVRTFDGYAVQVAAQPKPFSDEEMQRYAALLPYGNLYAVNDGKMSRLRLGVFATKAEADAANKQVQQKAKDAFVVTEKNAEEQMLVQNTQSPAEYNSALAARSVGAPVVGVQALDDGTASRTAAAPIRYAVQIASLSGDRSVDLNNYVSLASLGNIYLKPENDLLKVRIGIWEGHDKAEEAQRAVVQRGFKDAIVVTEKANDESLSNFLISSTTPPAAYSTTPTAPAAKSAKMTAPAPTTHSTTTTTQTPKTVVAPAASAALLDGPTGTQYLIRVCALNDLDNFEPKKLEGVGGKLEKWLVPNTNVTAIMLTGYQDVESALTALYRLRERNFPDAYLLKQENGAMSKLRY